MSCYFDPSFWELLSQTNEALLMLDYDGTLAPFQLDRMQAFPYPGIEEKLGAIAKGEKTRIVIVTGREIETLIPLFPAAKELEVWGCHGLEKKERGKTRIKRKSLKVEVKRVLERAEQLLQRHHLGEYMEKKRGSIGVHWRGRENSFELEARAWEIFLPFAAKGGVEVLPFDQGLELKSSSMNKGHVVEALLEEVGPSVPCVYLGDDLTDEYAFKALKGRGASILVASEKRETSADVWLRPPEELFHFFDAWGEA